MLHQGYAKNQVFEIGRKNGLHCYYEERNGVFILVFYFIFSSFITAADSLYSDQTVKLQIYLDKNNFSPGKIDGVDGPFTRFVFSLLDKTSKEEKANLKYPMSTINPLYIEYKIKEADKNLLEKYLKRRSNNPKKISSLCQLWRICSRTLS